MLFDRIIRAWKDPEYRLSLSEEEQALLPENPAGAIELTDDELETAVGGHASSNSSNSSARSASSSSRSSSNSARSSSTSARSSSNSARSSSNSSRSSSNSARSNSGLPRWARRPLR